MSTFLYISGLLIGIAAFIYFLSLLESGKKTINSIVNGDTKNNTAAGSSGNEQDSGKLNSDTIAFRNRPSLPPGTRVCPLCGSSLTKREGLYASRVYDKGNAKILIMGCRYCYKDEENSAVQKIAVSG